MPLVFWYWLCEMLDRVIPPSPFLYERPYKFTVKATDDDGDTWSFDNWFYEDIVTENNYLLWKICQFFLILGDIIDIPFSSYNDDVFTIKLRESDCITIKEGSTKNQVEKICREINFIGHHSIYSADFFYYYCKYGNVVIYKPTGYIVNLPDAPCMVPFLNLYQTDVNIMEQFECLLGKYDPIEPLKIYPNVDPD